MSRQRHQRIKELFLAACEREPDERAAFLQAACGDDAELRREVESLLAHHEPDGSFLAPITTPVVPDAAGPPPPGSGSSSAFVDQGLFAAGTVIAGRYRVVGLLGVGGMGEVYRADDLTLGQSVALKFLPAHLTNDPRWLERFHNEVRTAREVAHPNVCRVYDIGHADLPPATEAGADDTTQTGPRTFLTMEYVDGENLGSLLLRIGRLPKDKALQIARQMCAGLAAAHHKGVLHRDLKPANMMIDGRGQVRITDFGLAVPIDRTSAALSGAEVRAGTPAYMAPEQLAGKEVSIKSDLYALGLVLYEMFTGRPAFKAESALEYQRLHEQTTPTHPSRLVDDMDPAVERVILRCMEKAPERRPESALMVAAALPGGDPLAAALAAGQTPSPEMVAAAGGAGLLRPVAALALLVSIFTGMGLAVWLSSRVNLINQVPMPKPPAVLADRARQVIYSLGYVEPPKDSVYGFSEDQNYLDAIEQLDKSPSRWERLSQGQPSAIYFWYRQSGRYLVPRERKRRVSLTDPARVSAGTISVVLDPTGRLVGFRAVPNDVATTDSGVGLAEFNPPDWDKLLELAGLDPALLATRQPVRVPPVFADRRASWIGDYPSESSFMVEVEAASYRGQVTYFSVVPRWPGTGSDNASARSGPRTITRRGSQRQRIAANEALRAGLFVVALCFGSFLAWRNLKLGRGDRRGAFRISLFIFVAGMVEVLLGATHVPDFVAELTLFGEACGHALYLSAQIWLFYMALEPFVRRIWPQTIISWSRLLAGRFRDPLIGRDVLIGGTFATWALVALQVGHLIPQWLGLPPSQPINEPIDDLARLLGSRPSLAILAQTQFAAIYWPLLFLLVLLLLRVVLRKWWLVTAVFVLVVSSPNLWGDLPQIRWPIVVMLLTIMTYLLTRHGIVVLIATVVFYHLLTDYPLTPDVNAWYASTGYFALGTAALLALYAFYMSRAGRPLLSAELLDR